MIAKTILGSIIALSVGAYVSESALAQYPSGYQQYPAYQYAPAQQQQYQQYPQQQYPAQTQQYQQQYAPAQTQQYQQQYTPTQQYAPAQPAYAPAQTAYTQMPQYCSQNNAAAGAVMGTLLGAAVGGALGGGRGAAIGAGSGMLFGGMSGAQADAQCQQFAVQRAYETAAAQQAAYQQQAATQAGPLNLPSSAYVPVSVDYSTPSDSHRHRVTVKRLNSYSEPASRQVCDTFTKIDADLDGGTNATTTARRCKGPDGQWRDS